MKKLIITIIFFMSFYGINAQKYFDIGLFSGGSAYHPDFVNPSFKAIKPSFGGLVKYNLNSRYAFRSSIVYGQLAFPDSTIVDKYVPAQDISSFYEFAVQMEFNFTPFKGNLKTPCYSTYVAIGLAYTGSDISITNAQGFYSQIAIPFTVGWKYNLSKRFGVGVEWNVRKMISKKMGGQELYNESYQKHWYSFAGIVICYKFGGPDLGRIIWHI
ncbi:DUF6089 family protein [Bacteroidota bacterium]